MSTYEVLLAQRLIAGPYELVFHLLDVPKESFIQLAIEIASRMDEVMLMALTFGTLLSSQGADAHRLGPFGPFSGQPVQRYSVSFAPSNSGVLPDSAASNNLRWARD